ncbi:hypothetical protein [Actinoplanes teichomyceticus]|uniref:tRNA nuclease CdiA C-terminal domain-containing protein n=1 Tax=Actinoplanes teichomyceticus TaxID=1867 RepID=A0A561WB47_ACTTI|nr:hypothetical protein [Actinoplanes teichomyceticus]TWG21090.1 hypothetical protein FHX34_103620 [Actinoplanes teichomyceticus]GIF14909.1 hypothetical protein Ate01nite_49410 [Actinoplanes teichomyceticus]
MATTTPTGQPGGTPIGRPTVIDRDGGAETERSLARENAVAALLAEQGYVTQQNPSKSEVAQARRNSGDHGSPDKQPDYLIEGRVFDCYSPNPNTNIRNVWSYVKGKIKDQQTERVIVDLTQWRGDMAQVRDQFHQWPITGLKEVKVVTAGGAIVQIIPDPDLH